jgi:hypothetical protein
LYLTQKFSASVLRRKALGKKKKKTVVCGRSQKEQKCVGGILTFSVLNKAAACRCILHVLKTRPKIWSVRTPGQ